MLALRDDASQHARLARGLRYREYPQRVPIRTEFRMNAVATPRPQAVDPSSIFKKRYANFIGGKWVEPAGGQYFDNTSPITG